MHVSGQGAVANLLPKGLKNEIITNINVEGLSGAEAAWLSGINVKNIYHRLADGVGGGFVGLW